MKNAKIEQTWDDLDDKYGPGEHPQEILIEKLINDMMSKRHGNDWLAKARLQDLQRKGLGYSSEFDTKMKQFYSEKPKRPFKNMPNHVHEENFHELTQCVQNGTQPAFGYPIMDYGNRTFSMDNHKLAYPEALSPKFK